VTVSRRVLCSVRKQTRAGPPVRFCGRRMPGRHSMASSPLRRLSAWNGKVNKSLLLPWSRVPPLSPAVYCVSPRQVAGRAKRLSRALAINPGIASLGSTTIQPLTLKVLDESQSGKILPRAPQPRSPAAPCRPSEWFSGISATDPAAAWPQGTPASTNGPSWRALILDDAAS